MAKIYIYFQVSSFAFYPGQMEPGAYRNWHHLDYAALENRGWNLFQAFHPKKIFNDQK